LSLFDTLCWVKFKKVTTVTMEPPFVLYTDPAHFEVILDSSPDRACL